MTTRTSVSTPVIEKSQISVGHFMQEASNPRVSDEDLLVRAKSCPEAKEFLVAILFLRNHLGCELWEVASVVGLSPFHFHRLFRSVLRITPKRFGTRYQIERAKKLMLEGVPLDQVAKRLNFAHQSHLTVRFRQFENITPAAWLREKRTQNLESQAT